MQFITPLLSKIFIASILTLALGCALVTTEPELIDIKNPGPKTQTYNSQFQDAWKACLTVLGKYPLKSYDEESGIIETDYIRGEDVWSPPHRKKYLIGGYRYKLNLRVIKGRSGSKTATKVIIHKMPELQKDFFSDAEKIQSDGLEEASILYRIERELAIEHALLKVQRNN